ncbi:MAG: hypothetical protein HQL87_16760 [Magnetococcales bacterium]|nr:hypothetical protein [Magnetococcales bacterium]
MIAWRPFRGADQINRHAPPSAVGPAPAWKFPAMEEEVSRLFNTINPPLAGQEGLLIQLIGARTGEGTSTIAREFAHICALHSERKVLLLDLDWAHPSHHAFFSNTLAPEAFCPSPSLDLKVETHSPLYNMDAESGIANKQDDRLITFHRLGKSNLIINRLTQERVEPSQLSQLIYRPTFWQQAREQFALTVVDSPPAEVSLEGIAISGTMDAVIQVVEANATRTPVIKDLHNKLLANSAHTVGIVFNKRRFYIPKKIYRWF